MKEKVAGKAAQVAPSTAGAVVQRDTLVDKAQPLEGLVGEVLKSTEGEVVPITAEELVDLAFAILSMSDLLREEQRAMTELKEEMKEHKEVSG